MSLLTPPWLTKKRLNRVKLVVALNTCNIRPESWDELKKWSNRQQAREVLREQRGSVGDLSETIPSQHCDRSFRARITVISRSAHKCFCSFVGLIPWTSLLKPLCKDEMRYLLINQRYQRQWCNYIEHHIVCQKPRHSNTLWWEREGETDGEREKER